ncbi:crossover junction endodeoxyribonuclease RuvC [Agaribacterium haliotis]|uniref:crossover junction endodeoxyribonuclease RuvC n=1 Tax=Agaribacterium haliotis TaxID=2013869 RepID=UPI000BB58BC6|nr:crossover junction endodeoxyribonuclease RuvC [Agaribacterium haliotis]
MSLVLGVDPGSRKTGFAVLDASAAKPVYVASGLIRIPSELSLPERLAYIYDNMLLVIDKYRPTHCAIEDVFMANNARSALKLGQARGAAIVAASCRGLAISEYEARKVKQSVVGTGAADKTQVQHMVTSLLKLSAVPQEDAADALAVALCHINSERTLAQLKPGLRFRRGRISL